MTHLRLGRLAAQAGLLIFCLLWLFPLLVMLYASLVENVLFSNMKGFSAVGLENYNAIVEAGLVTALLGSLSVGIASALIAVILALGLGRWMIQSSRRYNLLLGSSLLARSIPPVAFLLGQLALLELLGVPDSRFILTLFHAFASLPLALLVLLPRLHALDTGYQDFTPLGDLAELDGLSVDKYLFLILCPNIVPEIFFAWLICFVVSWGEYLYAGILCSTPSRHTLPVLIGSFITTQRIDWGPLYAGICVGFVGAALLVIVLHFIIRGLPIQGSEPEGGRIWQRGDF